MTGCGFEIALRFPDPLVVEHHVRVCEPLPEPTGAVWVSATFGGVTVTAKGPSMAYTLPVGLQVQLKVEFLDAAGNHAKVDGDPMWSSSNPDICSVAAEPGNPYLAHLLGVDIGAAQVIVEADADLGDGVREVVCTLDVNIVAGEAVIGVITPSGEPAPPSPGGPG
jgi:hypothetical protein